MEAVAARLRDEIYVGSRISPVAGVILTGLNLELLDGVRVRYRNAAATSGAARNVVHLQAVHLKIVVNRAIAVRVDAGIVTEAAHDARQPAVSAPDVGRIIYWGDNSRRERENLRVIARNQGEICYSLRVHNSSQNARFGLHQLFIR